MGAQLGDSSQLPRCVSLVAVRLGHVLAVMAQLGEGQQHQGETAGGTDKKLPPLGTALVLQHSSVRGTSRS